MYVSLQRIKKVDSHNGSCLYANFAPLMTDVLPST